MSPGGGPLLCSLRRVTPTLFVVYQVDEPVSVRYGGGMGNVQPFITISHDGLSDTFDILEITTRETSDEFGEITLPIETIIGSGGRDFERAKLWAMTSVVAGQARGYLVPCRGLACLNTGDYRLARVLGSDELVVWTETGRDDIREGDLVIWDPAGELEAIGVWLGTVDSVEEFMAVIFEIGDLSIPSDRPQEARVDVEAAKLALIQREADRRIGEATEARDRWIQALDRIEADLEGLDQALKEIDLRD